MYKLHHILLGEFIEICISGEWPSSFHEKIFSEIYSIWKKHNKSKLLINIQKMDDEPSFAGDFFSAKDFCNSDLRHIPKIAIYDQIKRRKANDFFELTASNRGLKINFFYNDKQEAFDWLEQNND